MTLNMEQAVPTTVTTSVDSVIRPTLSEVEDYTVTVADQSTVGKSVLTYLVHNPSS